MDFDGSPLESLSPEMKWRRLAHTAKRCKVEDFGPTKRRGKLGQAISAL
jgi:hypothetical protein